MSETRVRPFQYQPIDEDLFFVANGTRTWSPQQASSGPGNDIRYKGGDAATGSNTDGGDVLLKGGSGDGTGKKGLVRVEDGCLRLKESVSSDYKTAAADEIDLCAGDDSGDTEFFAMTPAGPVQITKDGAVNSSASIPVVPASFDSQTLSPVDGGPGAPANGVLGSFLTLDFPSGVERQVRAEAAVPQQFRDNSGDSINVRLKYARTAGSNSTVRLRTSGQADNTLLGNVDYDLDVSATPTDEIALSPVIRTITGVDANRLTSIALILTRQVMGGEFTGDFRLVGVVFEYDSLNSVVATSVHREQFFTTFGSPSNGVMGSFKTVEMPPSAESEVSCMFTIPKEYQPGSDVILRLSYAMDQAAVGTVNLQLEGSINNVTALGPSNVSITPDNVANELRLTTGLLFITAASRLDDIAIKIRQLGTGTHPGVFRLVGAMLVMGATTLDAGILPEIHYGMSDAQVVSGFGTPDTDTDTVLGTENETYNVAHGTDDGQAVDFVYRCQLPDGFTDISEIVVPHKVSTAAGSNAVQVFVRLASGVTAYTSPTITSDTRAEHTVSGASLSSQPSLLQRFLVIVRAFVDLGEVAYVGDKITVRFA